MIKKQHHGLFVITAIIICIIAACLSELIFHIEIGYTHIFYIPIIISAIWYKKRGLLVALMMGTAQFIIGYFSIGRVSSSTFFRALMYVIIALTITLLSQKKEALYKELERVNILKNKKDETQLKEQFELFFSKSPIPTLITRQSDGMIEIVNPAFCEVLEYSPEEVLGKTSKDINLFENYGDREILLDKISQNGYFANQEVRFKNKQGQIAYFLISMRSIDFKDDIYIVSVLNDITQLKLLKDAYEQNERKYRLLFENALEMIAVIQNDRIKICNPHASYITGYTEEELYSASIHDLIHTEDISRLYSGVLSNDENDRQTSQTFRLITKNNIIRWIEASSIRIDWEGSPAMLSIITDVTERKEAAELVSNSEKQLSLLINQMQQGLAVHEMILNERGEPSDYRFLSINQSYEKITGLRAADIIGKTVLEVLPNTEKIWIERYGRVALTGISDHFEDYSSAIQKYFSVSAYSPKQNQFAVIVEDITDRKKASMAIEYISYHDPLTGLFNRRYYEEQKRLVSNDPSACPLAVVMIDVNGLKLVNDAFGHIAGDNLLKLVSSAIKNGCRNQDVIARIGGDEFIMLLPRTDEQEAETILKKISDEIGTMSLPNTYVSASLGYAVKKDFTDDFNDILTDAENNMYRHKLTESTEMRRNTIKMIFDCLNKTISYEEKHTENVAMLCQSLARHMNFSKQEINRIQTAGLLHDVGKIAVDYYLFIKKEALTNEERKEIRRHSEAGYRILNSINDYSDIAKFVLEHHEKWDGSGYPRGLKGNQISVQARIIAIADAYDAMISDREYRAPLSKPQAIQEIIRNKGIQFDPEIADLFLTKILGYIPE